MRIDQPNSINIRFGACCFTSSVRIEYLLYKGTSDGAIHEAEQSSVKQKSSVLKMSTVTQILLHVGQYYFSNI